MRNYFWIEGHGRTARVFFVNERRVAKVVAAGVAWRCTTGAAFHGVHTSNTTLPIVRVP